MTNREQVDKYVSDVLSGKIVSCQQIKMACKRYKSDCKSAKKKGFYFDEKAANAFIGFIEMLPHVKGQPANENRLLKLEPVQKFIIWNLFGWKWIATKRRRFRHAYIEMAKKNAKSTLAAAIALAMFVLDGEAGAEVYSAATTSDQANEVFGKCAVRMWQKSPWLQKDTAGLDRITKSQYQLNFIKYGSVFKALPGDADPAEGKFTHCAIIDEYHVHKSDALVNNLVTGSMSRTQPLIIRITTAGTNRKSPCYRYRLECEQVLKGITHDENLFVMIFTLDPEDYEKDNWKNPKVWPKAHPLWYSNPELRAGVKSEFAAAIRSVTKEVDFKTKMLSIWTDTAQTWITDDAWMRSAGKIDLELLAGRECFGGLDLSKSKDFSSFVLIFPMEDGSFKVLPFFWVPEEGARHRPDHYYNQFTRWEDQGFMHLTPGDAIDTSQIRSKINELAQTYRINSIGFDRAFTATLVNELTADGITLNPIGQGSVSMTGPIFEMDNLISEKKLHHGENPVLRWMMSNVLIKRDSHNNGSFDKEKSHEAIDGVVSMAMALYQYNSVKPQYQEYNVV